MNRRETVLMLRPEINCSDSGDTKALEQFTNTTLRPILKFQHIVLCTLIQAERYLDWELLNEANQDRKTDYFSDFVKKNNNLKNMLIGMTIALFSKQEMSFYLEQKKALNKRIVAMIVQRFLDEYRPEKYEAMLVENS